MNITITNNDREKQYTFSGHTATGNFYYASVTYYYPMGLIIIYYRLDGEFNSYPVSGGKNPFNFHEPFDFYKEVIKMKKLVEEHL